MADAAKEPVGVEVPALRPARRRWRQLAACASRTDLDWIEPDEQTAGECRRVCARCPVVDDCLASAVDSGEPWGIWGGRDRAQRAAIALASGAGPPRLIAPHGTNARYAKHGCRCGICRSAHTEHERRRRARVRTESRSASPADHTERRWRHAAPLEDEPARAVLRRSNVVRG